MSNIMIVFTKFFLLLVVCAACGQEPSATTASVTNGELVLGIVPVAGLDDRPGLQRYRLLVCKYLPEYSDDTFADANVCRSALLTDAGEEVDLVGNKSDLQLQNVVLPTAAEVRRIHRSPLEYSRISARYEVETRALALLSVLIIPAPITFPLALISENKMKQALKGNYENDEKERLAIGDQAPRKIPSPKSTTCGFHGCFASSYPHADLVTDKHWNDVFKFDFNDIVSVKDKTDLRDIIFSLADFLQLKVNERALFR